MLLSFKNHFCKFNHDSALIISKVLICWGVFCWVCFFLIQDNTVALIFSCDLVYNHSKLTLIKKCSILSIEENIFLHWKKGCKTEVLVKCFQKNLLVPYEGTVALQYKKDYSNRQEKKIKQES